MPSLQPDVQNIATRLPDGTTVVTGGPLQVVSHVVVVPRDKLKKEDADFSKGEWLVRFSPEARTPK
jgi:hypothetical protein